MLEFFITRTRQGFELTTGETLVDVFTSVAAAADIAVRFAQDHDAGSYRIIYP